MRRGISLGMFAAAAVAGLSLGAMSAVPTERPAVPVERQTPVKKRREASAPSYRWWRQPRPQGVATQRHTGAGAAGMHKAWKVRRASGKAGR